MSDAQHFVEIAFNAGPKDALSTATWTDITQWVDEVDIDRGRQRKLTRVEAGTCTVRLEDEDGRFNPANTSSPYWPDVKPNRRIRVRAVHDTVEYVLFSGFVDRWPQAWPESEFVPVTIEATDGFKILAQKDLPPSVWAYEVSVDSPSHWWRLGEASGTTAVDSGTADRLHDGTYIGSVTLGASGLIEHTTDTAVEFNGTDTQITFPAETFLGASPWSLEVMCSPNTLPTGPNESYAIVLGASPPRQISLFLDQGGRLVFLGPDSRMSSTAVISAGGSYHIVGVDDGASATIYVNGIDVSDAPGASTLWTDKSDVDRIGSGTGANPALLPFDGTVDEVVVYDSALSAARVQAHSSAVDEPWNGDASGQRIGRTLDIADWPSGDRDLDTGQTTFAEGNFNDDETVLDYLHRCAESENGLFFIDRNGNARFIERHASITDTVYAESQATFSDSPAAGEYNYEQFEPDYDDQLVNIATFQRKFGVTQSAEDPTSRAAYGDAELTRTALLMDTDAEAKSAAEWVVTHNAEPRMEVRRIAVHPELNPAVWPKALGLDLLERVTVERTPRQGGDAFTQEASIQGVSHRIRPTDSGPGWMTGWWLSPVDSQAYWILGDPTYSVLGSTTRLAY